MFILRHHWTIPSHGQRRLGESLAPTSTSIRSSLIRAITGYASLERQCYRLCTAFPPIMDVCSHALFVLHAIHQSIHIDALPTCFPHQQFPIFVVGVYGLYDWI
jgi:hypothetical protein